MSIAAEDISSVLDIDDNINNNNNNEVSTAVITTTTTTTDDDKQLLPPIHNGEKIKKKNGGAFSLLKAAMIMLRQKPANGKPKKAPLIEQQAPPKKNNWKKFLGSMRPLHLQDNPSSPPPSIPSISPSPTIDNFEDLITPASPSPSSVSCGTMSQYASASNLQELDVHDESDEEEDDPDQIFDAIGADEMIDYKAEEFIAHFYNQMKLQRLDHFNRYHHHQGQGQGREH